MPCLFERRGVRPRKVRMTKRSTFYSQSMTKPPTRPTLSNTFTASRRVAFCVGEGHSANMLNLLLDRARVSITQNYAGGCGKGNGELIICITVTHWIVAYDKQSGS